jgi:hypothetical protein
VRQARARVADRQCLLCVAGCGEQARLGDADRQRVRRRAQRALVARRGGLLHELRAAAALTTLQCDERKHGARQVVDQR